VTEMTLNAGTTNCLAVCKFDGPSLTFWWVIRWWHLRFDFDSTAVRLHIEGH